MALEIQGSCVDNLFIYFSSLLFVVVVSFTIFLKNYSFATLSGDLQRGTCSCVSRGPHSDTRSSSHLIPGNSLPLVL